MRRDLRNKRVLVTGASSGIGNAVARGAARRGAKLALTGRAAERLEALAAELKKQGSDAVVVPADLTRDEDRQKLVAEVADRLGGLDVLVNVAGVASFGHFADSTEEILRQIMEVNFFAPVELTRAALPHLRKGQQPAVMMVSSMCGRRGMPAWPEYSASKFALCGMTEAFRGEFARFDVDILLVVPGLTRSNLNRNLLRNEGKMKIPFDGGMPVEEVGENILKAIEANRLETVLGGEARKILFMHRFFPRLTDLLIIRRVKKLYSS
ncbi:MAG: SDR family oxidoreductase [Gemmataceae bacterium]